MELVHISQMTELHCVNWQKVSKCSGSLFSLTHRPLIREQQSCQPGQWSGEINVISPKNITNPYLDKKAWNVFSHHSLSEVCSCVAANTLTLTPSHSSHRCHNPHQNNAEKLYFTREKKVLTLRLVVIGISSPASVRIRVWFCQLFAPLTATGRWMLSTGLQQNSHNPDQALQYFSTIYIGSVGSFLQVPFKQRIQIHLYISTNKKYTTVFIVYEVQLTSSSPSPHFSQGQNHNGEVYYLILGMLVQTKYIIWQNVWYHLYSFCSRHFCWESIFFENHEIPSYF